MDEYMLIGGDVRHSISPCLQRALLADIGMSATYAAVSVAPDALAQWVGAHGRRAAGVNVTFPHKETVIGLLDRMSAHARAIGAVNTIVREGDALVGHNTDWIGAVRSLEPHVRLEGASAVVIGAGGAARAIVYGLMARGARVAVANRTHERASALARELGCEAVPLAAIPAADILVNATTVGMAPHAHESPVPARALRNFKIVFDIVYTPRRTRLLQDAQQAGCTVVEGVDMLVHQAIESAALWTGMRADQERAHAQALVCLDVMEERS